MIPQKQDKATVEEAMLSFVASEQFANFKIIMLQWANGQFKAMMDSKTSKDDLDVARQVLDFYIRFPGLLEQKVAGINKTREIELSNKLSAAQRYEE